MNIMQLVGMMKGGNPINVLNNVLPKGMLNNPMVNNVISMARNNDIAGLEQFAKNIGKEKGVDVDSMYNQIAGMFK